MPRRWLRNVPTADSAVQTQVMYWACATMWEFPIIDVSNATHFPSVTTATDGIVTAATPTRFAIAATNTYIFTAGDIGRYMALRDVTNPTNSGVYVITAIVDDKTVSLNSPVANFTGTANDVRWTLFDPTASPPPADSWFVVQSQGTTKWQARVVNNSTLFAIPAGMAVEMGAFGGFDATTDAWIMPVSAPVKLQSTLTLTFAVGDDELGFFVWAADGSGVVADRTGILLTQFAAIHQPAGQGVPKDVAPVVLMGDTTATVNTLNRLFAPAATAGFAENGQLSLADGSGYTTAWLHQWRRVSDDTDWFTLASGSTDPRSGELDTYQFACYHTTTQVSIRGLLPLIRMVNDTAASKTTTNAGMHMVVQDGVATEWDASTPI